MDKEKILAIAKEAGFTALEPYDCEIQFDGLEKFVSLIQAAGGASGTNNKRNTGPRPRRPLAVGFDALPDDALVTISVVMDVVGIRTTALYAAVKNLTFPAPERRGSRWSRWRVGDVRRWLANPK